MNGFEFSLQKRNTCLSETAYQGSYNSAQNDASVNRNKALINPVDIDMVLQVAPQSRWQQDLGDDGLL